MPDENQREQALRTIAEIKSHMVGEKRRIDDLGTKIANLEAELAKAVRPEMVEDLKASVRALSEQSAAGNRESSYEGEGALRKFVVDETKGMRGLKLLQKDDDTVEGGLLDSEPSCAWQRDLQEIVHERAIVKAIAGDAPKTSARLQRHLSMAPAAVKRIFADTSGYGAEMIPDVLSPRLFEALRGRRRLASLIQTMPMPKELRLPYKAGGLTPYRKGTVTANDPGQYRSSDVDTEQRSLTATGLAVRAQVDEDAAEDSIVAAMPIFDFELVAAIIDGEEDAIVNGDTSSTHQDTIADWNPSSRWDSAALGASDDHRRVWIGFRARGFDVSNTHDHGSTQTFAGFQTLVSKLAAPHGMEGELLALTSYEYAMVKMALFDQVVTVEKYGPQATILTGEVMKIGRVPVITSEFMTSDLAATGLFTDGSAGKSSMVIFNRSRFWMGERRGITVESAKDITRGVFNLVATKRGLFFQVDSSTHKNVALAYNLL